MPSNSKVPPPVSDEDEVKFALELASQKRRSRTKTAWLIRIIGYVGIIVVAYLLLSDVEQERTIASDEYKEALALPRSEENQGESFRGRRLAKLLPDILRGQRWLW